MPSFSKILFSSLLSFCFVLSIVTIPSHAYQIDKNVVDYMDYMDSKYYPIFIESINMIQNKDFKKLKLYYTDDLFISNKSNQSILIADYCNNKPLDIIYKYRFSSTPYKIIFPINWAADPENDVTWVFYFQNLNWLNDYLKKGENGDKISSLIAFKVINDWIVSNPSWPPKHGQFVYDDHGTALRLKVFYRALRLYNKSPFKDDGFYKLLLTGILNQIAFLATEEKYGWHNHGIILDSFLLEVLYDFSEFKAQKEIQRLATKRLIEQFRSEFTSEGVHNEHSTCYHVFVLSLMFQALDLIKKSGQPIPADVRELVNKSAVFYTYILKPDGTFPDFGDCSDGEKSIMPGAIGKEYFKDHPEVEFSLTSGQKGVKPGHAIKVFPESGYAIFRDKWPSNIYAAIKSEFHSMSHYHEDDTSFIVNAFGHDLIINPGIHSYNKGPFDIYMRRAEAHNVLLVDDKDYDFDLANTGLSGITRFDIAKDELSGIVELTHSHYDRLGVKTYRMFGQIKGGNYVVKDTYKSENSHIYSQLYHFAPGANIERQKDGIFRVTWEQFPYSLWLKSDYYSYDIVKGSMDPVQGWYFPTFRKAVAAPVLKLNKIDNTGEFLTYLCITRGASSPDWDELRGDSDRLFQEIAKLPQRRLVKEAIPSRVVPSRKIKQDKTHR